jgi:hypothetical protein
VDCEFTKFSHFELLFVDFVNWALKGGHELVDWNKFNLLTCEKSVHFIALYQNLFIEDFE